MNKLTRTGRIGPDVMTRDLSGHERWRRHGLHNGVYKVLNRGFQNFLRNFFTWNAADGIGEKEVGKRGTDHPTAP